MTECTVKQLQAENRHLRDLVASLSAALLRNITLETSAIDSASDPTGAERLFREAEECFRCARLPGLNEETAHDLETAGNKLMAEFERQCSLEYSAMHTMGINFTKMKIFWFNNERAKDFALWIFTALICGGLVAAALTGWSRF